MGIPQIQKKRILEEISRSYFSNGEKPRLIDVLNDASQFFSKFPLGSPLPIVTDQFKPGLRSDVEQFNELLARFALNIDILYQACTEQSEDIMTLTTMLRTELERLRSRRQKIIAGIDDKLFALYNTDGYYYSISDTFYTLDLIDLALTSAFIDTQAGTVQLPTLSSLTKRVDTSQIGGITTTAFVDNTPISYKTLGSFGNALDGLTNTLWGIEISTDSPQEVVVIVNIQLGVSEPVNLSRVDFDPYGMTPVQIFTEVITEDNDAETSMRIDFGNSIKTSPYNMSFVSDSITATNLILTLRKLEPDYTVDISGTRKYRYIFGAKNVVLTQQVYDTAATVVSEPLMLPGELVEDNVIDAVSLVVDADIPDSTEVTYYVAADTASEAIPELGEFDWKRIVPLSDTKENPDGIVRFEGARSFSRAIKANPGSSDLGLIPLDSTNSDLTKRNPSARIIPGVNIYRIAKFEEEDVLPASVLLEEGVNTTRIMYTPWHPRGLSLDYWKDYVNGTAKANLAFGRINSGNEFFYGGDIGESGKSVFVETFLESSGDQPLILKEFAKVDPNSRMWDVKVLLNGREVGDLPVGIDKLVIPWKFQEGLNHIIVLVQIPSATTVRPNPYVGTLDLMGDDDLNDFGTVKLGTWQYVDFFKMQYNEVDDPYTFTIYDGEIVSRRKPTTNFRIKYSKATSQAPTGVRVRIDLKRNTNNQYVTPIVKSYRLRFLYGDL